jgi:hypothetical protein
MKARIEADLICECGWRLYVLDPNTVFCPNRRCRHFQLEYKRPSIALEPVTPEDYPKHLEAHEI